MYDSIVVPLDGSDTAARALQPAAAVAAKHNLTVTVTSVVPPSFATSMAETVRSQAALAGIRYPIINLMVSAQAPAGKLLELLDAAPGALLCMSTSGRSHLGQALGSVAEEVLRALTRPALLIGPSCQPDAFKTEGVLVVPTDGSAVAEEILPLAGAWADAFDLTPIVVTVGSPGSDEDERAAERAAAALESSTNKPAAFEILRGESAASTLVESAADKGAALIAMSTHGYTGLARLIMGSNTVDVVHKATCPVLVHRPPRLRA